MDITFVDDSLPFDGWSPSSQPLGGPEKAFAVLPSALAMRGHRVRVFNRATFPVNAGGAVWETWDGERPAETDVLVAFRLPRLLEFVPQAKHRVLWTHLPAALGEATARAFLSRHRPDIVVFGAGQRDQAPAGGGLAVHAVEPGVAPDYLEDEPMTPTDPPHAISTAHPLGGLDWLLALWSARIRPAAPTAELHVYSAMLDRGALGGEVPGTAKPVLDRALAARAHGVVIKRPLADPQMAEAYRRARVHLYPGQPGEAYGFTLAESQAAGLPAVARANNPAVIERIRNGRTGMIAATDDAFVSAAVHLLGDRLAFERMSEAARADQRGRTWAVAAAEFEALLA